MISDSDSQRWTTLMVLGLILVVIWTVLSWSPPPPPTPASASAETLSWNDYFSREMLPILPVASDWITPLRPPRGEGVWLARPFGSAGHLGEDWNTAKGDQDLGEPVYSPADGWVSMAIDFASMWGEVVSVVYRRPAPSSPVEILFAHLQNMQVRPCSSVKRGQILGYVSNAQGVYRAHLHWEVRTVIGLGLGGGYSENLEGWVSPSDFLQTMHPEVRPYLLTQPLRKSAWAAWGSD